MFIYLILGLSIEDTQCGAKVFKREIIPLAYNRKFLTRWLFDVEIFLRMKKEYGKEIMNVMHEQALDRWVHVDDSKLGFKDALEIPLMLLNIWYSYNLSGQFAGMDYSFENSILNEEMVYNNALALDSPAAA